MLQHFLDGTLLLLVILLVVHQVHGMHAFQCHQQLHFPGLIAFAINVSNFVEDFSLKFLI